MTKEINEKFYSFDKDVGIALLNNLQPYDFQVKLGKLFKSEINRKLSLSLYMRILFLLQEKTIVSDEEYD